MKPMRRTVYAFAALLLGATACSTDAPREADAAPAPAAAEPARPFVATVTAEDYSFEGPDTLVAGATVFRMINRGDELHHIQLVRLESGHTPDEFLAALASHRLPDWAIPVGGPSAAGPGQEISAEVDLEPGTYALTCMIPSPDGVPHIAKGMVNELTVVPGAGARPSEAVIDLELRDYGYVLSQPLTAGTWTLRIHNTAQQPHEVLFVKLEEGRTMHDMAAWVENHTGPPPGLPIGGVGGIANGLENRLRITLESGARYALLCFLPDAGDGRPHVAHGMMQEIEID